MNGAGCPYVLLNLSLFAAMGAALVSGFIISKAMFPNSLTPADYLRWHGVHDTSPASPVSPASARW